MIRHRLLTKRHRSSHKKTNVCSCNWNKDPPLQNKFNYYVKNGRLIKITKSHMEKYLDYVGWSKSSSLTFCQFVSNKLLHLSFDFIKHSHSHQSFSLVKTFYLLFFQVYQPQLYIVQTCENCHNQTIFHHRWQYDQ